MKVESEIKKPVAVRQLPYSEATLLEGLTPETAHADALASLEPGEIVESLFEG